MAIDVILNAYLDPNVEYPQALNENFDCMTVAPPARQEEFLPLDALFDAEEVAFRQDFYPNLLDSFRHSGTLYGLPAASQPGVIAYNVNLLEKRGVSVPPPNWTFEDYVTVLAQTASTDENDLSYGTIFTPGNGFLLNGRDVVWVDTKTDPPTPMFNSTELANALAWVNELIKSGMLLVSTGDEGDFANVKLSLKSGKIAFWSTTIGHLGEAGWLESPSSPPNFPVGVLPIPTMKSGATNSKIVYTHFISSQTKYPEVCWDWIKYLSEQTTLYDGVPGRRSVAESIEWEAYVGKENASVYRQALEQSNQSAENDVDPWFMYPFQVWERQIMISMIYGENYTALLPVTQKKAEAFLACMVSVDRTGLNDREMYEKLTMCVKLADPDWQ